jgi:transcriptional regulator with XRE-family HTH domain
MGRPRRVENSVEKARRIRDLILIRAGRTALGMSQRDLAKVVNLHFSALARFESGHLRLKQEHIERILEYFEQAGVSYEETDQGDLLIQLSGDGLNGLATIDDAQDDADMTPRFRL